MSDRWLLPTLATATAIPFGLLGGFGATGDHSILPWLGMLIGWGAWMLVARCGISRGWWLVAHDDGATMSQYFKLLGVKSTATSADVKRAFRKRAKRFHPDQGGDAAKFCKLVEAKQRLLDELAGA
jgi:hypothetical protein